MKKGTPGSLHPKKLSRVIWGGLLVFAALFGISLYNYLLFHILVEGFSVMVAVVIYILASRTYSYTGSTFLLFLGIICLFTGIIDFMHTITYSGMNIFDQYGTETPTQLWIAGRYLQSLSLLIAPLFISRRFSYNGAMVSYGLITVVLIASIMVFGIFPSCYEEGRGLTPFKIGSEYIIATVFLAAAINLHRHRNQICRKVYLTLAGAILICIVSEIFFTMYQSPYGIMNYFGHICKAVYCYLIFNGIFLKNMDKPFNLIFERLQSKYLTDPLTGLYNRLGFTELSHEMTGQARTRGMLVTLTMIDLDGFKVINDNYGHPEGDKVLQRFAGILLSVPPEECIACRPGGDEFILLCLKGPDETSLIVQRIRKALGEWKTADQRIKSLDLSAGTATWNPLFANGIECLIKKADEKMYLEKKQKKQKKTPPQKDF